MAAQTDNEYDQQEWDMEFKDPFSLEEEESTVYCPGSISQTPVTRSCLSEGSLGVETVNAGLLQKVTTFVTSSLQSVHGHETGKPSMKLPDLKENSWHLWSETDANMHSSTTMSVEGSKKTPHVNAPVTKLSHETNVELNRSEVTSASSDEQSPIPVMLSSAKRFCASEDIQKNSHNDKHGSAYLKLPPPSAVLNDSPVRFAQSPYQPVAYNIPAWPAVSLPLHVNNSGSALPVHPMVPYSIPYSAVLPHSTNISALYNRTPNPIVEGTDSPHWPGARLHLQNILTKPPPPVPSVSHGAVLRLPASDVAVLDTLSVPQLRNGLTPHRFPLATIPHIPPFPSPNVNRLPFSNVILPRHGQPLKAASVPVDTSTTISAGQVLPNCYSVGAQQRKPLSAGADVSACLSSSAQLKSKNNNNNNTEYNSKHSIPSDRTLLRTEQSGHTLPVTGVSSSAVSCSGVLTSNFCPPPTSSELASKQTVTPATDASCSNTPPPPPVKCNTKFAQLDPRIRNGNRQNSGAAAAQSQSSANTDTTPITAFVVPVPPPLPSLEELTADITKDSQKEDKAAIVSSTPQFSASGTGTITADTAKFDTVMIVSKC